MNFKKCILFLLLPILFSFASCNKSENTNNADKSSSQIVSGLDQSPFKGLSSTKTNNKKTYVDKQYKFKVNYPGDWTVKITKRWEATNEHEASPDGGIYIYPDKNKTNTVFIYGQYGKINVDDYLVLNNQEFSIDKENKGILYYDYKDGKTILFLLLDDGLHAAHIEVSDECFSKNKQQIFNILKSIKPIKISK